MITVTLDAIYKPWLACDTSGDRALLKGVRIDPAGYAVAADGFCLVVVPCKIEGAPKGWNGAVVPGEFLGEAHKRKVVGDFFAFFCEESDAVAYTKQDITLRTPLIKGDYPKWRTLIPGEIAIGAPPCYTVDSELVSTVCKALGKGYAAFELPSSNTTPCVILGDDGAFGVLMPIFAQERKAADYEAILALHEEA